MYVLKKRPLPWEKSFCVLEYHTSKSVVTVQRAFRADYAKDPPTDMTIRTWYKQFTETGCMRKQKSSGCPLTAEDDVKRIQASFVHSPKKSMKTAKKFFNFSVAVNNSIKVGPLVFLL
jgi:hypothetical protein